MAVVDHFSEPVPLKFRLVSNQEAWTRPVQPEAVSSSSADLNSAGTHWMESAVILSSELNWPLFKMTPGQSPSPAVWLNVLHSRGNEAHGNCSITLLHLLWMLLWLPLVTVCWRFEQLPTHSESWVKEKLPPATSFFTKVSLFYLHMSLNYHFRSFLVQGTHFSPLPLIAIFQCLNSKSQRGSFCTAFSLPSFQVLYRYLN